MKTLPEPEPEKKVYLKPTAVWSPSMGGQPMPLGQEGTYGAVERNRAWEDMFSGQWMRDYRPNRCIHAIRRYTPERGWSCPDCGAKP